MAEELRELVELESPSTDRAAVDSFARRLTEKLAGLGVQPEVIRGREQGDQVRAVLGEGEHRILVLCHMDTVWPVGEVARRPVRVEGGRLYGPGAYDMKAGIVQTLWALRALRELGRWPGTEGGRDLWSQKSVVFLYTSDEEIGSPSSRPLIEAEATRSRGALVLEPAGRNGGVKLWRKGVAGFRVRVEGRAAHAGADPERGISAVHELCRQVLDICALANPEAGTTVNVGVIRGGSRPNVVAAEAEAEVDFRAGTSAEMDRIVAAMSALRPHAGGAVLRVTGGVNRPPMERTAASEQLYRLARDLALSLGFDLPAEGTGGASDGNFTAHLGVPTLDGLGAVGDGGHSPDEYVVLDHLPRRTALLVRLLETI
ncbi:MAG: M20 family metallopeptidase [Firmicutes bacterium]|nr:M20 family metallopeptidase [Bacillota bacterium]